MFEQAIYDFLYGDQGFRPFRIHLSNGVTLNVPHMDYALLPPHRQYLIVESVDNPMVRVNLSQITHVEEISRPQATEVGSTTGKRN